MAEGLQKRLETELQKLKSAQAEYQKCVSLRQQLDAQLNENTSVKEEMDRLNSDSKIYKLIGPALVQQDYEEAKQNVQKRLEYISGELKRQDKQMTELEKKQTTHRDSINKIQHQFQQAQVKAAAKA